MFTSASLMFSISVACFSESSIALPSASIALREKSASRNARRRSLHDEQFCTICVLISLSMSVKSHVAARRLKRVWYVSSVSPISCFSFLKTYTSYSIFFFGEKYAVSLSHALSKSSDSPVSVKVSNMSYRPYLFTRVMQQ